MLRPSNWLTPIPAEGFYALPAAALTQYAPKEIYWIGPYGLRNRNKFRHVDLALIALDHPYHGVRTLEPRCQIALREACLFAGCGDDFGNGLSGRTSQCFQGCAPIN